MVFVLDISVEERSGLGFWIYVGKRFERSGSLLGSRLPVLATEGRGLSLGSVCQGYDQMVGALVTVATWPEGSVFVRRVTARSG
ncbi:hypothetical protein L249_4973 [Ophiocordyceps polyrhachis-furcata BCC 54312]|uniref:Uncharacterized protein n=1 Tax=Ophiocordyceps polyrhachis-furcata BCC 54312 TaxID=1330021 RepID=A0A367L3L1_9HYPO|nr:hypothetical protein L249_4973 [Ophiocordyceps polyrhachis-furcata BCC 54312]